MQDRLPHQYAQFAEWFTLLTARSKYLEVVFRNPGVIPFNHFELQLGSLEVFMAHRPA